MTQETTMTPQHPTSVVAIDGGQTGCRARLSVEGRTLAEVELGPIFNDRPLEPQVAAVIAAAVDRLDPAGGGHRPVVAMGSTGLDESIDTALVRHELGDVEVDDVVLAHDSVTSYLGALGHSRGAVVAAGTGVVTLAVGAEEVARVDGWGFMFGDDGSGYWIGNQAVRAVLRSFDGRGPATALTEVVRADHPDLEKLYLEVSVDPLRVSHTARYARSVAGLAGIDEVAAGISRRAGELLVESVEAGLRRVGEVGTGQVARIGNVFRSEAVRCSFDQTLARRLPEVGLVEEVGTGLDGAERLAGLASESPLRPKVLRLPARS